MFEDVGCPQRKTGCQKNIISQARPVLKFLLCLLACQVVLCAQQLDSLTKFVFYKETLQRLLLMAWSCQQEGTKQYSTWLHLQSPSKYLTIWQKKILGKHTHTHIHTHIECCTSESEIKKKCNPKFHQNIIILNHWFTGKFKGWIVISYSKESIVGCSQ